MSEKSKKQKPIRIGEVIPSGYLYYADEKDYPHKASVESLAADRKVILFIVPGRLDPTIRLRHLSDFMNGKACGFEFDEILCISVDESYLKKLTAGDYPDHHGVRFLADCSATYTGALGLKCNLSHIEGLGFQYKIFALLVDDLKLKACKFVTKSTDEEALVYSKDGRDISVDRFTLGLVIPDYVFEYIDEEDQLHEVSIHSLARGKSVLFFVVTGALDATIRLKRVDKFIKSAEKLKLDGTVDEIFCISVNEPIGMKLWSRTYRHSKHVKFLADRSATFIQKVLGFECDRSDPRLGIMSTGYSFLVKKLYAVGQFTEGSIVSTSEASLFYSTVDKSPSHNRSPIDEESLQLISAYGRDPSAPSRKPKIPSFTGTEEIISWTICSFDFPLHFAVTLIGDKGSTIKEIRAASKAQVSIEVLEPAAEPQPEAEAKPKPEPEEKMSIMINGRTSHAYVALGKIKAVVAERHDGVDIRSFPHTGVRGVFT